MFTPNHQIDGKGDRPDLATARDGQQRDAFDRARRAIGNTDVWKARKYGTSASARSAIEVAIYMIKNEVGSKLILKSEIDWGELYGWAEAVEEACIQLGLDSDDFSPLLIDHDNEVELCLYS